MEFVVQTPRRQIRSKILKLMVGFSMAMSVVTVIVREENLFVGQIASKKDSRRSKTGEESLEAVPAREGTCIPPCLTIHESATETTVLGTD